MLYYNIWYSKICQVVWLVLFWIVSTCYDMIWAKFYFPFLLINTWWSYFVVKKTIQLLELHFLRSHIRPKRPSSYWYCKLVVLSMCYVCYAALLQCYNVTLYQLRWWPLRCMSRYNSQKFQAVIHPSNYFK